MLLPLGTLFSTKHGAGCTRNRCNDANTEGTYAQCFSSEIRMNYSMLSGRIRKKSLFSWTQLQRCTRCA